MPRVQYMYCSSLVCSSSVCWSSCIDASDRRLDGVQSLMRTPSPRISLNATSMVVAIGQMGPTKDAETRAGMRNEPLWIASIMPYTQLLAVQAMLRTRLPRRIFLMAHSCSSIRHIFLPKAGALTTATVCIERVAWCLDTATCATVHTTYAPRRNDYDLHGALEE